MLKNEGENWCKILQLCAMCMADKACQWLYLAQFKERTLKITYSTIRRIRHERKSFLHLWVKDLVYALWFLSSTWQSFTIMQLIKFHQQAILDLCELYAHSHIKNLPWKSKSPTEVRNMPHLWNHPISIKIGNFCVKYP